MAWTLEAIREELASRLSTYGIQQAYAFTPSTPVLPCVIISPVPGQFAVKTAMDDDVRDLSLVVITLVSKVVDEYAQNTIDDHISPDGVWDTLEISAVTNKWDFVTPTSQTGYGQYTFGAGDAAQQYLGFTTQITVGCS